MATGVDLPLKGQVAIVTGASSGIGAAVSKALARAGAKVAMAARREDRLRELQVEIESVGGTARAIKTDVTDRASVKELVRQTEETLGPVDILVNNAGIMFYSLMKNLKEDEWQKQIDVNCKGFMNCIGGVLEGMTTRQKGHIVNMSSNGGRKGFGGLSVYCGTKFFVEGVSQGMRQELVKSGVKVTCIQPGDTKTEIYDYTTDLEAKELYDMSTSPLILEAEDIARAVLYAVTQPPNVAVNELLIEPRELPM